MNIKDPNDIIVNMLDGLAYELIAAYSDYYTQDGFCEFCDYLRKIADRVESDRESMEEV